MAEKKLDKTADKKVSDKTEGAGSCDSANLKSNLVRDLSWFWDQNSNMEVDAISTGSFSLDLALGIGGVPERPYRRDLWS